MKVQETKDGHDVKITFIPENEEEQRIMGTLRNHFFYGMPKQKTYPDYAGITTANNFVTSLSMNFKAFDYKSKCIKLTKCVRKLPFVKAILQVTDKPLLECKKIADILAAVSNNIEESGYKFNTVYLDDLSITMEQWKKITQNPYFKDAEIEFEYV